MLNRAILMGRLVADPELRQTPNGVSVTSFRIAVDRNFNSKSGERQADFLDIVAWRQTAEFITRYFTKGRMIALEGSIQTRGYEDKNGNKRTAVEIVADNVYFADSKPAGGAPAQPFAPPMPTQAPPEPSVSYASGDMGDFSEISSDSDDLPF